MKKRKTAKLYPEKEDITIRNFIIENQNLIIFIILILIFFISFIGSFYCIDFFRAEHVYNYI